MKKLAFSVLCFISLTLSAQGSNKKEEAVAQSTNNIHQSVQIETDRIFDKLVNIKGAKEMLDKGLLSIINPNEIYGLHVTDILVG